MSTEKTVIGVKEVAELLGVPVKTIYHWRSQGGGPPGFRAGKHLRYRRAAVEKWMEEQERADRHTRR